MVKNLLTSLLLFCLSPCLAYGQDGGFVVTEKSVTQAAVVENDVPYFVLFTSFGCDPCNRMKATEVPKLEKAGYTVVIVDINQNDTWNKPWGITNVPRTFLIDRKTRSRIYGPWVGFSRAGDLIAVAKGNRKQPKVEKKELSLKNWINSNYNKNSQLAWGVSGQSVYDHLCDGSHGTHVFTRDQVKDLELWEALALHDAIHRGKFKP
jgi:hypothetical protein